jgi:hypothetical protein
MIRHFLGCASSEENIQIMQPIQIEYIKIQASDWLKYLNFLGTPKKTSFLT